MKHFQLKPLVAASQAAYFENDNSALIPEFWAMESLLQLTKLSVYPWLVYRDFENVLAQQGQVVNAHRPAEFVVTRKGLTDDVVVQDAKADTVPVVLNQHLVTSFLIRDGEESKSMTDLIDYYLAPAIRALSEGLDKVLAAQVYKFLRNSVGKLGTTPTAATLSQAKAKMTNQRVPVVGRTNVLTANTEASLMSQDLFIGAQMVGDDGTAMREGSLGRKFGANNITDIATPSVFGQTAGLTKVVSNTGGYPKGYTGAITLVTGTAHALHAVLTIAGSIYTVKASTATSVTLNEPLREAIPDATNIYQVQEATVTNAYAAGWLKPIAITGLRGEVGEAVRDIAGNVYTVIQVNADGTVLFDLPLVNAFTAGQKLGVYPDGEYNFCFHQHALALVCRPLAAPKEGSGAISAVVEHDGLSLRVVIAYIPEKQGHMVTIDMLAGVTVLDERLGTVLLA